MDTSHYKEERNEVATLQSAVQNSPENPLHYMKLLETLKTNDSSEIHKILYIYYSIIRLLEAS